MLDMVGTLRIEWLDQAVANWLQFGLSTPVVFWCGWPFFQRAGVSLKHRSLNMFSLVAVGVSVAYCYSVLVTLAPHLVPTISYDHGSAAVYFESAAVIITLVLLGQFVELKARNQTGNAIKGLLALIPNTARLIRDSSETTEVDIQSIIPGDILQILPGNKIPVDAIVVSGESTIDESMLTGEAFPTSKQKGDKVTAGTVNQSGALIVKADRVGRDTLLAQIISMVATAQRSQAPVQRLVDKIAAYFVPAVFVIAIITFFVWLWLGPQHTLPMALMNAVAVLIIACPCSLGLATPMSVMVTTGQGAAVGILIKTLNHWKNYLKLRFL